MRIFLEVKQGSPRRIGNTSVKIQSRGHFALLTCGRGFWQASCPRKDGVFDPNLHLQRIWVTDQNNVRLHFHLQISASPDFLVACISSRQRPQFRHGKDY
jgi:hypothetical protein